MNKFIQDMVHTDIKSFVQLSELTESLRASNITLEVLEQLLVPFNNLANGQIAIKVDQYRAEI